MVSGQNEGTNEQNQMFVCCGFKELKEMESCVWHKAQERESYQKTSVKVTGLFCQRCSRMLSGQPKWQSRV